MSITLGASADAIFQISFRIPCNVTSILTMESSYIEKKNYISFLFKNLKDVLINLWKIVCFQQAKVNKI